MLIVASIAATAVSGCGSTTNAGTQVGTSSPGRSATPAASACTPGPRPPARMGAAMAYDAATKTIVLFGGIRGDGSPPLGDTWRSEEHTSELQSPIDISYAVFCL